MKKLLFGISIFFIAFSVSAKEIDLNHTNFDDGLLYVSGDVYKNVETYLPAVYFRTNEGYLAFLDNNYYSSGGKKVADMYESQPTKYVAEINGKNVFDIEEDYFGDIKIPKYKDEKILWIYSHDYYGVPTRGKAAVQDNFYPYSTFPEFVIECDKEEVKYGETANCIVKMNNKSFIKYYVGLGESFKLFSEDYEISNVKTSRLYKYDKSKDRYVFDPTSTSDGNNIDDFTLNIVEYDDNNNIVKKTNMKNFDQLNDFFDSNDEEYLLPENTYAEWNFDVLTFTITPKNEEMVKGVVYIKNINLFTYNDEIEPMAMDDVNTELLANKVKPIETVEENPETGVLDYTLLFVIPITLIGIYFLVRKSNFKRYV